MGKRGVWHESNINWECTSFKSVVLWVMIRDAFYLQMDEWNPEIKSKFRSGIEMNSWIYFSLSNKVWWIISAKFERKNSIVMEGKGIFFSVILIHHHTFKRISESCPPFVPHAHIDSQLMPADLLAPLQSIQYLLFFSTKKMEYYGGHSAERQDLPFFLMSSPLKI